ncbi:MAG TPA: hypothetical protein VKT49_05795 [Bryobacteraceae bacterium]|nr:hypothetical protein [Bryobacteraceae bacterium]
MRNVYLFGPSLPVLAISAFLLAPGIGRGDSGSYLITGGFTTFTGNVDGSNAPNYIRALPVTPGFVGCTAVDCSNQLLSFEQICPDAGCTAASGVATDVPITYGNAPSNRLTFEAFSCPPGVSPICTNTANELDFIPNQNPALLSFNDPGGSLIGSLTFTNGVWTGDADFGITITATDVLAPHNSYNYTGILHMSVTPTDPHHSPEANADYVYFENVTGKPLDNVTTGVAIGSFRVYELFDSPTGSNTATVNLYASLGSLDLTRLADVTGDGFLDVSTTNDLGGPPPAGGTPLPEPGSLLTLLTTAGCLVAGVRRKHSLETRP